MICNKFQSTFRSLSLSRVFLVALVLLIARLGQAADLRSFASQDLTPWLEGHVEYAQNHLGYQAAAQDAPKQAVAPVHRTIAQAPAKIQTWKASAWFEPSLRNLLLLFAAILVTGIIAFRKSFSRLYEFLVSEVQYWFSERGLSLQSATDSAAAWPTNIADEGALADLRAAFQGASAAKLPSPASASATPAPGVQDEAVQDAPKEAGDSASQLVARAPGYLATAHHFCEKINRTWGKLSPKEDLREICDQVHALRADAKLPEFFPLSQSACALEGLLHQLRERVREVTPSTLHTISSALDLLGQLCTPALKADFATNPPIRILAVDDDAVSRYAISFSLKKAFNQPDLAENAEAALALAVERSYDVIFLDVKMPGMDGFELCTKIHETTANRVTPVIFVTGLKDFDSRSKSITSGGSDLIAKPFLTFEITVKALTFALRRRLEAIANGAESSPLSTIVASHLKEPSAQAIKNEQVAPAPSPAVDSAAIKGPPFELANAPGITAQTVVKSVGFSKPVQDKLPAGLLASTDACLAEIRGDLKELDRTEGEEARWKILAAMHFCHQKLVLEVKNTKLLPAFQLCVAVDGLMKKLVEKPSSATPSTLHTVVSAVDLLQELCAEGVQCDLASEPAISILVVDDEPLTRRAITGALQTAFLKPENAENGEAAVIASSAKLFDVIFMDIQMPGMDGFKACAKIHETVANRTTPVVFVTSHSDNKSREQSAAAGGSDFVIKPFIFAEITVKALVFALRGRLEKTSAGQEAMFSPVAVASGVPVPVS
ncbi:MAG: signaling protein [Pedosphaera sp.]|nr:signaling protein [Pedosphaera sp.]